MRLPLLGWVVFSAMVTITGALPVYEHGRPHRFRLRDPSWLPINLRCLIDK
jgi:hypothetical protein